MVALPLQHQFFDALPELTIRSTDGRPVPLHVDGDYIGRFTEAHYTLEPQPLLILG